MYPGELTSPLTRISPDFWRTCKLSLSERIKLLFSQAIFTESLKISIPSTKASAVYPPLICKRSSRVASFERGYNPGVTISPVILTFFKYYYNSSFET